MQSSSEIKEKKSEKEKDMTRTWRYAISESV